MGEANRRQAAGKSNKVSHCHEMVYETALGIAHEQFDHTMKSNDWYDKLKAANPDANLALLERQFVAKVIPLCIEEARATLAAMLRSPGVDIDTKDRIHEALVLDSTLKRGRQSQSYMMN